MRMIFWRRFMRHGAPRYYMAFADKIRGMSEEDYNAYKSKMDKWNDHCCHNGMHHCHKKDETTINPSKD